MSDHPNPTEIESIRRQVEEAIKSGRTDSELESSREVRQAALRAIIEAERVDPKRLRRPITI